MKTEADRREAARQAGETYGAMAADLSLMHASLAPGEEAMEKHILNLARNIREQVLQQRANDDLGEDLALVWKEAALKAAQARLKAFGAPGEGDAAGGLTDTPRFPAAQPLQEWAFNLWLTLLPDHSPAGQSQHTRGPGFRTIVPFQRVPSRAPSKVISS